MHNDELLKTRIKRLGGGSESGLCVLYVMSRDQRVQDNHALLAAQKHATAKELPLAVVFCLTPKTGFRAREQYEFMLAGLHGIETNLARLGIPFMMLIGDTTERLGGAFYHLKPDAAYFDFSPLRGSQAVQKKLSDAAVFPCFVVDTHNVVPVWTASDKLEVGARTLRPKINRLLAGYSREPEKLQVHPYKWHGPIIELKTLATITHELLKGLKSNGTTIVCESGEKAARQMLDDFLHNRLNSYAEKRNDPSLAYTSDLSPYLHFGQLSSLRVVIELQDYVSNHPHLKPDADTLVEEMVVRKELSDNWCYYNQNYDNLKGAPQWAQNTLAKHASDPREFLYSLKQFEVANTHDPAWNAAQKQMTTTGKMHGYMRMYWAKKVLEWTESPGQAIDFLIRLNDLYSLDGGDPNGYAGIMWSIAGVHDRPWGERPIYGKVRSMVYGGLKRKFDISAYEQR